MAGVVFVNPHSGPERNEDDDIASHFPGHAVVDCEVDDLPGHIEQAVADEVDFVAVAGGDGTIRSAVQVLACTGVPLLPVPAGTRNHFARELGIEDVRARIMSLGGGVVIWGTKDGG